MTIGSTPAQSETTSKIVLLVDDNPTNLEVLFEALSQSGLRLLVAEDGEAALEQVEYMKPDIILMDVMMPCLDGFETCRRLKSNPETVSIPVIFMTALDDTVHKLEGLSLGGVDYITKPIDPDEVLARVNVHLTLRDTQMRLHEQNRLLKQEIQYRQRIEQSLKLLIRSVSHDLRNPVTGLLLVLKTILKSRTSSVEASSTSRIGDVPSSSSTRAAHDSIEVSRLVLERMVASATHQLDLINSLLDTHSLDPEHNSNPSTLHSSDELVLHYHPFEVNRLIDNVVSEVKPLVETNQGTILTQLSRNLPDINGDMNQLWRVFENLITNAVKHNPPGITITITAEQKGNTLVCQVCDDGRGISANDQQYLFEPYHRGQSQHRTPGLGLGLYLCRQIIEAHSGHIEVSSDVGCGAIFEFTIPI